MDLRGGGQEKRLGMPSSLGPYNNNNNPSSSSSIGEPAIPSKISPTTTTTTITSVISTRRDLSSSAHNTGNGISVLDHHHHYQQQQQIRQDSPDPPPPQPPAQTQDPDRDPDPVSIAVVSAAIASISAPGSNPRTPKPIKNLSPTSIRYRECLKNHAASIGGHVVDGCGEFMPGGEEGTPEALKCAACDCHRNFHLKEVDGEPQHGANCFYCYNPNNKIDGSRTRRLPLPPAPQPLAPPLQQHHHHHQKFSLGLPTSPPSGPIPPMMMAFGGGGAATDSSSEELNVFHSNAGGGTPVAPPQFSLSSKKRFRTKFTQEQKDKMLEFAEKVGWRIQKQDELAVQQFCAEVGVKRQVLKVWMHNNKHAMKKKDV